jgi:glycosyltransferase involved in cell wall biosynthesis
MMISLLMPTRGRPTLAERFMRSAFEQAESPGNIEVVLYVDKDDEGSHKISACGLQSTVIVGPQTTMGTYHSACLAKSGGDIVMLCNDDIVIRTRGWDRKLLEMHTAEPDRIYLAYPNDLFKGRRLCTFPILSRRTCEILEDPFPAIYRGSFIDYHLLDIFKRLAHAGHNRICYLEDLVFEHMHYRLGKAKFDETYRRRIRFEDDPIFFALKAQRSAAALRLKSAIEGCVCESRPEVASEPVDPHGFRRALIDYWKAIMPDRELPPGWRVYLYMWFIGRYLASKGYLRFFEKTGGAS